ERYDTTCMSLLDDVYGAKPPATLFHYTSYGAYLGIISSRVIWASSIHYLNDAKEFALGCSIAGNLLRECRARAKTQHDASFLGTLRNHLDTIKHINVFVTSFSQIPDLLS